jgi:hypothetical protein
MKIRVLLLVGVLTSCEHRREGAPADSASATSATHRPRIDSATAVQIAVASFAWPDTVSILVRGYREDSAGTLIRLVRICPPDADCYGNGGTVRVGFDGDVREVQASDGP